jgi:hypothetical protein
VVVYTEQQEVIRIISARKANASEQKNMTTVRYTANPKTLPPISDVALAKLDALKDKDIDYSDIPELDDVFLNAPRLQMERHKPIP